MSRVKIPRYSGKLTVILLSYTSFVVCKAMENYGIRMWPERCFWWEAIPLTITIGLKGAMLTLVCLKYKFVTDLLILNSIV